MMPNDINYNTTHCVPKSDNAMPMMTMITTLQSKSKMVTKLLD